MKKLLITLTLLYTGAVAFGQAYVSFFNGSTTRVSTNGSVFFSGTGPTAAGPAGSWYYALLVAPTTQTTIDASLTGWSFVAMATNSGSSPGRLAGGRANDAGVEVPGYTPVSYANFAVVGWSGDLGSDWNTVYGGKPTLNGPGYWSGATWSLTQPNNWAWYGISSVASNVLLESSNDPLYSMFGLASNGLIPGMTLYPAFVPEPSVLAVLCLGAGLLFFRRNIR